MPCVDFKAIKAAVSIEDAANLLKLPLKKSGNQLRGNCPACGKEDNVSSLSHSDVDIPA
jgi:hypothetical protein